MKARVPWESNPQGIEGAGQAKLDPKASIRARWEPHQSECCYCVIHHPKTQWLKTGMIYFTCLSVGKLGALLCVGFAWVTLSGAAVLHVCLIFLLGPVG